MKLCLTTNPAEIIGHHHVSWEIAFAAEAVPFCIQHSRIGVCVSAGLITRNEKLAKKRFI